jgi:hypothetical protein
MINNRNERKSHGASGVLGLIKNKTSSGVAKVHYLPGRPVEQTEAMKW